VTLFDQDLFGANWARWVSSWDFNACVDISDAGCVAIGERLIALSVPGGGISDMRGQLAAGFHRAPMKFTAPAAHTAGSQR
jgi:hypothetical protein